MNIKDYIKSEINKHEKIHEIYISDFFRNYILNGVENGIYAFHIIYHETIYHSSETETDLRYTVVKVTDLEHTKVKSISMIDHGGDILNKVYSIYGDDRFQWSEAETFLLDISIIRQFKLNDILN
jgi:hypothetical protein